MYDEIAKGIVRQLSPAKLSGIVDMLRSMGVETGLDIDALLALRAQVAGWLQGDGVDISYFPRLADHYQRMQLRPAVRAALHD